MFADGEAHAGAEAKRGSYRAVNDAVSAQYPRSCVRQSTCHDYWSLPSLDSLFNSYSPYTALCYCVDKKKALCYCHSLFKRLRIGLISFFPVLIYLAGFFFGQKLVFISSQLFIKPNEGIVAQACIHSHMGFIICVTIDAVLRCGSLIHICCWPKKKSIYAVMGWKSTEMVKRLCWGNYQNSLKIKVFTFYQF